MQETQVVRCPNCGSWADRRYFTSDRSSGSKCPGNQVTQTECQACDYLMASCSLNGRVLDAYAPFGL